MSIKGDLALLAGRAVLGSYLATHGAQKVFGSFGGGGLEKTGAGFDQIGLRPGHVMARMAGASEFAGGLLTLAGAPSPLGPVTLLGTMAVASTTHRANGPMAANRGYELALTNAASALVLAVTGPGRFSVDAVFGTRLPKWLAAATIAGGLVASAASIRMLLTFRPDPPAEPGPEPAAATSS
jgi:putative oxidoreductase